MSLKIPHGYKVLLATSLVSAVLGSIHAFSVFLEPLESKFGASRASVSLTYSFGLVFLTAAVLFGPSVYSRLRPTTIYITVSILASAGATLAGLADNIAMIWVGYSVMFGIANGLGYGFGLQLAARANPKFSGFAMGVVTAAYALGASLAPYFFELAMINGGISLAMFALAACIAAIGLISTLLIAQSQVVFLDGQTHSVSTALPITPIFLIWISYGSAVFAGLMVIGHAASLATQAGFTGWIAPAGLASFNLLGSLISGWLIDRMSHRRMLTILPLIGAASLVILIAFPGLTLACLALVGFAYGGTIAAYPAAISEQFPSEKGPRAYGHIFTAWGVAGLLAPWTAGKIFDTTGDYQLALWGAFTLSLISALVMHKSKNGFR